MSSIANRVIKNTGFLYAKMGITMFISLYTTRLILNSLGASDFGIFNIVGGAISMLGFLNAAMASATQRFMSYSEGEGNKEKQKSIFNVSFILHLTISIIVGIALLIAGYFFFNGILNIPEDRIFAAKVVYGSLIVSTMFTVMTVPYDAAMNAHENMKYYAIVGVFESFLKLFVALICVYTNYDKLIIYGSLMACIPLITLSVMRIYCHRNYDECIISPKKYWIKGLMKEMTSFAGWNLLSTSTAMITNYGLGIVLNIFFGTVLNASQGIANQLNGQMGVLTNNISKAVLPIVVKSAGRKEENKMISISLFFSKVFFIIMSMILIPFLILGDIILEWWLKDVPPYTNIFLILVILVSISEIFLNSLSQMISAIGRIKYISFFRSLTTLLCLPTIFLLFKCDFPPYVMYIVLLLKTLVNIGISLYFSSLYYGLSVKEYLKNVLLRCILFFTIILLSTKVCGSLILNFDLITKIIIIILVIFLLLIVAYILTFDKYEKKQIISVIQNIKNKINK